ncbi:hypothetical protein HUN42_00086 [Streptomyces phage Dagobah]|nr:hypothetical protein HUN42_00086 [Streptomyces phage Dagobah]
MANTPEARKAADNALWLHIRAVGGTENEFTTQVVDLIADLLLLLPDDETANQVVERAAMHASQDRAETV